MTAEATVIAAAMGRGDMRPGFGESLGPGKASAGQTTNMGTAEVRASAEVHSTSANVATAEVHATAAKVTAAPVAAAATASSEGSCWNRRAAQKDGGNSHNHRSFHHQRLRAYISLSTADTSFA
jgi:hypothetical protein